jgi:hypothetical protein
MHLKALGFDNDEIRHRVVAYCPQVCSISSALDLRQGWAARCTPCSLLAFAQTSKASAPAARPARMFDE